MFDIHEDSRNLISQVLGNEIKFAMKEPLGLRMWQFVSAVIFTGVAVMALTLPDQLYEAVFDGGTVSSKTSTRLYGGALFSISLIIWNSLYTSEKVIIRWTLLTKACFFTIQFIVTAVSMIEIGTSSLTAGVLLFSCLLFMLISVYFYYQVGRRPKKL
ncbi:hypothetical protein GDO86_008881 [Hymenochirus boettgeri]|uniref:Tumor protein p53-inducible protein 11 n=1 Tax=Hymenochirus boettgeri TaxID=247094 RepID=A0A8T2J4K0_9PIPI|nr:hypothetical protein GDO86_008881 [Hymenochirus boettgeri]